MTGALQPLHLAEALDLPAVVQALTRVFESVVGDEEYRSAMHTVVPGAGHIYGVRVPALRALAKQILKAYKRAEDSLQDLAEALWDAGSREHRLVALFLLGGLRSLGAEERWKLGVQWLPEVSDWETCDQLCSALLGEALAHEPKFFGELEGWLDDANFWVRRAALVATVYLRRASYPLEQARALDRRVLGMCGALLDDGEKYVRKAVDWAVREVIGRHHDLAFEWMMAKEHGDLGRTARTTLKLAAKKLEPEAQRMFLEALEG